MTAAPREPIKAFVEAIAHMPTGSVLLSEIDLSVDPPPDLAIEIDISNRSQTKFPIYASLGVPEIWQYKDGQTRFYRLTDKGYQEIPASDLFSFLTPDVITDHLNQEYIQDFNAVKRKFRKWVRQHKPA